MIGLLSSWDFINLQIAMFSSQERLGSTISVLFFYRDRGITLPHPLSSSLEVKSRIFLNWENFCSLNNRLIFLGCGTSNRITCASPFFKVGAQVTEISFPVSKKCTQNFPFPQNVCIHIMRLYVNITLFMYVEKFLFFLNFMQQRKCLQSISLKRLFTCRK